MSNEPDRREPEEILAEHGVDDRSQLPPDELQAYGRAVSRKGLAKAHARSVELAAERRREKAEMSELERLANESDEKAIDEFNAIDLLEQTVRDGGVTVSAIDEKLALRVLRKQLKSKDERVAQTAALKILEWRKGKPGQAPPPEARPQRIVLETAFALNET